MIPFQNAKRFIADISKTVQCSICQILIEVLAAGYADRFLHFVINELCIGLLAFPILLKVSQRLPIRPLHSFVLIATTMSFIIFIKLFFTR